MRVVVLHLLLLCIVAAVDKKTRMKQFGDAMNMYQNKDHILRSESNAVRMQRFKSFEKYADTVDELNSDPRNTFRAAYNFLSILTPAERELRLGRSSNSSQFSSSRSSLSSGVTYSKYFPDIPSAEYAVENLTQARNWKKTLGEVKDQSDCGSCWSFAAAAVMESAIYRFTGKRVNISEQEYNDCVYGYNGCYGGWEYEALEYSKSYDRAGLASEIPYGAKYNSGCRGGNMYEDRTNALVQAGVKVRMVAGRGKFENREADANDILLKILSTRTVSVGVYAGEGFQAYASGVLNVNTCDRIANHAVAAIGYGTTGKSPWWLIRNSWGGDWGEGGHMRILRDVNICTISWTPTYPVLECRDGRNCVGVADDDANMYEEFEEDKNTDKGDISQCYNAKLKGRVLTSSMGGPIRKLNVALEHCFNSEECKGVYKYQKRFFLSNATSSYKPESSPRGSFVVMKCTDCSKGFRFCDGRCQHEHWCSDKL